ncbi:MAG: BolA family protein [Mariprofundaceae bacterium]
MSDRATRIRQLLEDQLKVSSIQVEDESWKHAGHAGAKESGGGHFTVHIVADCFAGLSQVQRHRLVYKALGNEFGPTIHAVSIKAMAPGEP